MSPYLEYLDIAKTHGYESAAKQVYGNGPHKTPKSLAQFLRKCGMGLENIAAICNLRFGVGCASSVRRWTDPTVDKKWNAYRRSLRNPVSYVAVKRYARFLWTRGFTKAEIVPAMPEEIRARVQE